MRVFLTITAFLFFNTQSFSQWKSYYPNEKFSKKKETHIDEEKKKQIFEENLFYGIKAKSLENYNEALVYFEKCITTNKNISLPFYESAIIYQIQGNYKDALEKIKNATRLEPENKWYLLLHAELLFLDQNFFGSAKEYEKLINLYPYEEELYFKLADVYIYSNKFKKAIKTYDNLEKNKGLDRALSIQKYKLYRDLNNIKGAIKEISSALNVFSRDIELMEMLAELHLLNNEKSKAFTLFKQIGALEPDNGRIHLTLADYYRESGENEKSYIELKKAFKSSTLNIDTKIRILISYYQLISISENMKSQAYELAKILIETHPENLASRAVFGDILYTDKKYQEAKKQYLFVLEKDKTKKEIWSQILFIQVEASDFDGLLKTSKEALDYFPAEPLFYYFNGISNKRFDNYEEAVASLQTGVDFVVENNTLLLEFYSSLGDLYNSTNKHTLSDKYYNKALEIDSNNAVVLNNYAYYLSLRQEGLQKAKKMSFKSNQIEPNNGTYQDTYAWVLYKLKEYKKAQEWILKALLNGSENSPVVVEHYGDILYQLGDVEKATDQWKKAKELGGESEFLIKKIQERKLYE